MSRVHDLVAGLREEDLTEFVLGQRWFGSKSREVAHVNVIESTVAREEAPALAFALVEIRFHPGTHETYHVPVGVRPAESGWSDGRIAEIDGQVIYDATADPELVREIAAMMSEQRTLEAPEGATMEFCSVSGLEGELEVQQVRPMGVEQSNTSLVFDDRLVLKLYRRLEPGINPELELLRFLTEHGFPNIPALEGWAQYLGKPMDSTLATLQHFVESEGDGWKLALDSLAADPEAFLSRVRRLGEVTGAMHTVLASDSSDTSFCPEDPSGEALAPARRDPGRGDRGALPLSARRPGPRADRRQGGGGTRAAPPRARTRAARAASSATTATTTSGRCSGPRRTGS